MTAVGRPTSFNIRISHSTLIADIVKAFARIILMANKAESILQGTDCKESLDSLDQNVTLCHFPSLDRRYIQVHRQPLPQSHICRAPFQRQVGFALISCDRFCEGLGGLQKKDILAFSGIICPLRQARAFL